MSQPVSRLQKTKHLSINSQQQQRGQQHDYHPEQNNASDPLLDRKIEDVASGLVPYYSNVLGKVSLSNKENALTIISYINTMRTEANLSDNYRKDLILLLSTFSNYFQNKLPSKI
jgi:hypothetical protein